MVDFRALLPKRPSRHSHVDWMREQTKDRVVWIALGGSLPFVTWAILRGTLTSIIFLQAYLLTSIEFGLVLFVQERDNIRRLWLWKAMIPCTLVHLIVLAVIFSWDKANPQIAATGFALAAGLLAAALVELYLMLWIIEMCRPSDKNVTDHQKQSVR
ncbi:MAG TPA: hypothetical protein VN943_06460 [Candidatus Acidoferrum sp.]|nr:hypothetical protein [Candidatus Acidoferrum sp.]